MASHDHAANAVLHKLDHIDHSFRHAIAGPGTYHHGLVEEIRGSTSDLSRTLLTLGDKASMRDSELVSVVDGLRSVLREILDTLRSPAATAAEEDYRIALRVLRNGWLDDAVREIRQMVIDNRVARFDPRFHFLLGEAEMRSGRFGEAAEAYRDATRFALPLSAPAACSAALLGAAAAARLDDSALAIEILRQVESVGFCPEVRIALARHRYRPLEQLVAALTIAPELAADAAAMRIPELDEACRRVLDGPDGLRAQRARAADQLRILAGIGRRYGVTIDDELDQVGARVSPARQVTFLARSAESTRERVDAAAAQLLARKRDAGSSESSEIGAVDAALAGRPAAERFGVGSVLAWLVSGAIALFLAVKLIDVVNGYERYDPVGVPVGVAFALIAGGFFVTVSVFFVSAVRSRTARDRDNNRDRRRRRELERARDAAVAVVHDLPVAEVEQIRRDAQVSRPTRVQPTTALTA